MKYYLFLILLFCFPVLASFNIEVEFTSPEVKQGSLAKANFKVSSDVAQGLNLNSLKGKTLGEVLYLHELSPLVKMQNSDSFVSEATVIFVKVPGKNSIEHTENTQSFVLTIGDVKVLPTEQDKKYVFGTFEVPHRPEYVTWILIALGILITLVGIFKVRQRLQQKSSSKKIKNDLKSEILSTSDYQAVVELWKKKSVYLTHFPKLDEAFKNLENDLFKVQFKPQQSEQDKIMVLESFKRFKEQSKEGFDGI